ncbi:MAG: pyruvate kinase [Myxococcota bacterium]
MRRAKIVCTLGPASNTSERVAALVDAGMDCARLNFSHGDHESHRSIAEMVRGAAAKARRSVSILADLSGPKIRIGRFAEGKVELRPGQEFRVTTEDVPGTAERVSANYPNLPDDVKAGDPILIDDGLLRLRVRAVEGNEVVCEVEVGGTLSNNKGLNLPGARLSIPSVTDKDKRDLAFAVEELKVDYLALSFVRTAADVREAQSLAGTTPVIAKMEKPEAIENLQEIADAADGLMVARGDLGVELGSEKVPMVQKRLIREANLRGKVVITATQMLDSMIRNPRPTRAEAADVANAILDGTDAVMLSGETASGAYPLEAVGTMSTIVQEVEGHEEFGASQQQTPDQSILSEGGWEHSNAAVRAAALMSFVMPLKAIVVFTRGGRSAQLLSEYRPKAPILAITSNPRVASRMALHWGVRPYIEVPPEHLEETLRIATALVVREKVCTSGDTFALVSGWPTSARPNTVKLHRL